MKKNFSAIVVTAMAISLAAAFAPQPVRAFNLQNTFSSATAKLGQQFRKVYLALPGDKSAEAVLEQTALAMEDVSTVTYNVELDATLLEADNQLMNLMVKVSGPAAIEDIYQPSTARQDLNLSAELVMEGTALSANADLKIDGDVTYLKVNQMPLIPFLQVGQLKDQWVVFEAPTEEFAELDAEDSATDEVVQETTEEQQAELQALYIDFIRDADLSSARKETVDGTKVFTIDMTLTADAIATLAKETAEIQGKSLEEIQKEQADLDQALAQLEDVTATIMVDRSNYYIKKTVVPLVFTITEESKNKQVAAQLQALGDFEAADALHVTVTTMFSEYNQPVEFTLPADAVEAAELFTSFGNTLPASLPEGIGSEDTVEIKAADLPAELEGLSAEEKEILKQYGVELNGL